MRTPQSKSAQGLKCLDFSDMLAQDFHFAGAGQQASSQGKCGYRRELAHPWAMSLQAAWTPATGFADTVAQVNQQGSTDVQSSTSEPSLCMYYIAWAIVLKKKLQFKKTHQVIMESRTFVQAVKQWSWNRTQVHFNNFHHLMQVISNHCQYILSGKTGRYFI